MIDGRTVGLPTMAALIVAAARAVMQNLQMPDVFLSIKYHADCSNRVLVERLREALAERSISTYCIAADLEEWGGKSFSPSDLMLRTFEEIERSLAVVVEFSEKGVGLGIEAGYAFAKGIPVIVVMAEGSDLSETMEGIALDVFTYDTDPSSAAHRIADLCGERHAAGSKKGVVS